MISFFSKLIFFFFSNKIYIVFYEKFTFKKKKFVYIYLRKYILKKLENKLKNKKLIDRCV